MPKFSSQEVFLLSLVRSGLWGGEPAYPEERHAGDPSRDFMPDWKAITEMAKAQTVVGLVGEGIGRLPQRSTGEGQGTETHATLGSVRGRGPSGRGREATVSVSYPSPAGEWSLRQEALQPMILQAFRTERRNAEMDAFLSKLITKLREEGILALVVKGQAVGHLYANPSARQAGDIDLFLDKDNYEKAKAFLSPKATTLESEGADSLHLGMQLGKWTVELHGTLHAGLNRRINAVQDRLQAELFAAGDFRRWECAGTEVLSPSPLFDAEYILLHCLQHLYYEGIGLRQFCDWAVHLDRFGLSLDRGALLRDLEALGILEEWKGCASFVVDYLGVPAEKVPLYDPKYRRRGARLCRVVLDGGNFGVNFATPGKTDRPLLLRKLTSFGEMSRQHGRLLGIFPKGVLRTHVHKLRSGLKRIRKA